MKKIDWYIIRKFLGTFAFTVLLFTAITVVIDLSERIDDFLENQAPWGVVVTQYYFNFIPHIVFLLTPMFIFIAVIFFTSKLAGRSEIIAMLASGISFYRLLFVPYLFSAVVLFAIQLYGNHYMVPNSNKERLAFESSYFRSKKLNPNSNVHMQIDSVNYVYVKNYNPKDSSGTGFTLETIRNRELVYKLSANKVKWNGQKKQWQLTSYKSRSINGLHENLNEGMKLDTVFNLHPKDFQVKIKEKESMTTRELSDFIDKLLLKGAQYVEFYQVEKHRRTAIPFATFILTFIGFGVASRKVRGGMGLHLLIGIAISFTYILFLQFSMTFATKGNLSPFLSVWIPNVIFGVLSVILVIKSPK